MTEQGLQGCWELVRQWRKGRPSSQGQDAQDNFKKEESFKCLSPEAPQCSFCGPESSSSLSDLMPLRGPIFLCFPVTPPLDPSPRPQRAVARLASILQTGDYGAGRREGSSPGPQEASEGGGSRAFWGVTAGASAGGPGSALPHVPPLQRKYEQWTHGDRHLKHSDTGQEGNH